MLTPWQCHSFPKHFVGSLKASVRTASRHNSIAQRGTRCSSNLGKKNSGGPSSQLGNHHSILDLEAGLQAKTSSDPTPVP